MRSMPSVCGSSKRGGSFFAFAAARRRFPPGASYADAGALPRQQASGDPGTSVAGRDGLSGRGPLCDADGPRLVATLCMDGRMGRTLDPGLASGLHIVLYRAGTGGEFVAVGPWHLFDEQRRTIAGIAMRKLTNLCR